MPWIITGRGGSDGSKMPKLIERLQGVYVVRVFCGNQFSLALTSNGQLYSWGKGDNYRLGHTSEEHVRFPKLISALEGKFDFLFFSILTAGLLELFY